MSDSPSFTHDEVIEALGKILASQPFKRSKRASELLLYLVTETLEGRGSRIKAYSVALEVFNRDEGFNPETDSLVRVQAGRLRRSLEDYYNGQGKDELIEIKLEIGGYVPQFVARTPPAFPPHAEANTLPKLAVCHSTALYDGDEVEMLAQALTQQLVHDLARFRKLHIVVVPAADADLSDANYVLSSSVAERDNELRVAAQLVEQNGNRVVWSEVYKRQIDPGDEMTAFDDISSVVAATIGTAYGVIDSAEAHRIEAIGRAPTTSYEHLLSFHQYMSVKSVEGHLGQRNSLEQLVVQEPGNARAWAMLSSIYGDEARYGFNARADRDPAARALAAAQKAIEFDPTDSFINHYFSVALMLSDRQELSRESMERAFELNPNDTEVLADHAWQEAYRGNWDSAEALIRRAITLNPRHPSWYRVVLYGCHYVRGDYDRALAQIETRALRSDPLGYMGLLAAYADKGDTKKALEFRDLLNTEFPGYLDNFVETFRVRRIPTEVVEGFQAAVKRLQDFKPSSTPE